VLAIRLHEIERGTRPNKLQDLADAGFIDSVPDDPYAERPFSYSHDRGVVWSVGNEGKGTGEFIATSGWDQAQEEPLSWTWRVTPAEITTTTDR
jgi:hypothetical protein